MALRVLGLLLFAVLFGACGSAAPSPVTTTPAGATATAPASASPTATNAPASPTTTVLPDAKELPDRDAILISKRGDPPASPRAFCVRYSNPSTGRQSESCKSLPTVTSATLDAAQSEALNALIACWSSAEAGKALPGCWR